MNGQPQDVTERLYQQVVRVARSMKLRRLTYRCGHRCELLDAIETPQGILLHQKRYKLSPPLNDARSSEAGRRKNTLDGINHWRPRTYYLETSALAYPEDADMSLSLQCDHVKQYALTGAEFAQDWLSRGDIRLPRVSA